MKTEGSGQLPVGMWSSLPGRHGLPCVLRLGRSIAHSQVQGQVPHLYEDQRKPSSQVPLPPSLLPYPVDATKVSHQRAMERKTAVVRPESGLCPVLY